MPIAKKIFVTAGHGGGDNGAVARGTTEAAQAIDITNRVVALFRADGRVETIHVPDSLGLRDSISWINARSTSLGGLAIEIHKNAGGGTGVETWYYGGSDASKGYAKLINDRLAGITGLANRGYKPDTSNRHGRLGFVRDTKPWALLIEAGFIDVDNFDNAKYAQGIYEGCLLTMGLNPKTVPKPTPAPVEQLKWLPMDNPRFLRAKNDLSIFNVETGKTVGNKIPKGTDIDFQTKADYKNVLWVRSKSSTDKNLNYGINYIDVEEIPEPIPPPKPVDDYPPEPELDDVEERIIKIENNQNLIYLFVSKLFAWGGELLKKWKK